MCGVLGYVFHLHRDIYSVDTNIHLPDISETVTAGLETARVMNGAFPHSHNWLHHTDNLSSLHSRRNKSHYI
ncbi:hypothetical protein J6590_098466 [Homalodisca vitripennis]|nr:hypothetical protein J6590_098466 [Homalodisca vitripennis]